MSPGLTGSTLGRWTFSACTGRKTLCARGRSIHLQARQSDVLEGRTRHPVDSNPGS